MILKLNNKIFHIYTIITLSLYIYLWYYPFSNIVSHKIALITTRKLTDTFAMFDRTQYWTLRCMNTLYSQTAQNFTKCGIFSCYTLTEREEFIRISTVKNTSTSLYNQFIVRCRHNSHWLWRMRQSVGKLSY